MTGSELPATSADGGVPGAIRLERWDGEQLRSRLDEALDIYVSAMGYPRIVIELRREFFAEHTRRQSFRSVVAIENGTERLVGFGYGYRTVPGQWWHDQVRAGLSEQHHEYWMSDSFELVELHVLPDSQGHGLGHSLLRLLLEDAPWQVVLLSTPEGESRAWRLYRRCGFADVLRNYLFPGDSREFAVLGRSLPLALPNRHGTLPE
jgi:ribosomal protein S18 acetylase RimI-like enzyme